MQKRGKLRYETLCDRRCSGSALDDFAILNGLAIQRLVAGLVWFQYRAIEVEAGERSLGVSEKENFALGSPWEDFPFPGRPKHPSRS